MASSTIDSLFQLAPPRLAESARGPEAAPFDPALRQALAPVRRTEQPPAPASPSDEPEATAEDVADAAGATDDGAQDRKADEAVEIHAESPPVEDDKSTDDGESSEDETEISEAAAAALAAATVKTVERGNAVPKTNGEVKVVVEMEAAVKGGDVNAPAPAGESASEAAAQLPEASDAGVEGRETTENDAGEPGPLRAGRDKHAMEQVEHCAATDVKSSPRPVETPSEQDFDEDAEVAATDEKAADVKAPAVERGERQSDFGDRVEAKQNGQSSPSTSAVEAAVVEAVTGAKAEAPADHAAAKADASPPVAAPNSAPRSAASLEKLVGPRGVLPAAAEGTSADGGAPVDRARFVQRVEGALRRAQDRDGRLHVRLSPPELGSLRVEIALQNGVLTAKLEAETTAARNLIMENLPALRERLAQQDVRIERFDVDVRRDGDGSGGGSAGDNGAREHFAERSAWRQEQQRARSASTGAGRVEAAPAAKPQANASGLDILV